MRRLIAVLVVLLTCGFAAAQQVVVGDINSTQNDLSWMISTARPWNGHCAEINGQMTDTLPSSVEGSVQFKSGTFPAGWYRGWFHAGDFVFYEVEGKDQGGESRKIVRAGRCGNPATGRYYHKYPVAPVPSPPVIYQPQPPPPAQQTDVTVNAEAQFSATVNVNVQNIQPATIREVPRYVPGAAQQAMIDTSGIEFPGVQGQDRVQVGSVWGVERERQRVCPPPQPPPPSPYCPPGVAPTPPAPPAAGGTTDPPPTGSGGGNPGPNIPPDQPDHGVVTPPNSGAPPPSAPWIADPVTENP